MDSASRRVTATFTVVNSGRGDTSIIGFHLTPCSEMRPVINVESQNLDGPTLPYRVEGNSQMTWIANILPAARQYGSGLDQKLISLDPKNPSQIFLTVQTGNGKFVHDKSARFDAYQLVAGVFPPD